MKILQVTKLSLFYGLCFFITVLTCALDVPQKEMLQNLQLQSKKILKVDELPLAYWYNQHIPKTYLLSYPRSGNTWMRYCIECLLQRPTLEYRQGMIAKHNCPLGFWWDLGTDFSKDPVWKVHDKGWMRRMGTLDPQAETLILIVRNYKEAITRHMRRPLHTSMLKQGHVKVYFDNLLLYEAWNPAKRLLIYYEDLLSQPEKTLKQLVAFFNGDVDEVNAFMLEITKHKKKCVDIYVDYEGPSLTQGKYLIYHSHQIEDEERKNIDTYVAETYPLLWQKYLNRYADM